MYSGLLVSQGSLLIGKGARFPSDRAAAMLAAGEFPAGSMGPKIEAALTFLEGGGREVIITTPELILEAVDGTRGTRIVPA